MLIEKTYFLILVATERCENPEFSEVFVMGLHIPTPIPVSSLDFSKLPHTLLCPACALLNFPLWWVHRVFQSGQDGDRSKSPCWDKEFGCCPCFGFFNFFGSKITDPVSRSFQEGACKQRLQKCRKGTHHSGPNTHPTQYTTSHGFYGLWKYHSLCLMVKKSRSGKTVRNFLTRLKLAIEVRFCLNVHQPTCNGMQLTAVVALTSGPLDFKTPVSFIPMPSDGAGRHDPYPGLHS